VPVHSKRERNTRNGFANIRGSWLKAALSLKPTILAEAMTHPGWIIEYVKHGGTPTLENWLPYAPSGASPTRSSRSTARMCRRTPRPGKTSKSIAGCSRAH
jgi:L-lactate dehydrogenase (cytochrome)/(S)-mandelate dehydrogenase